nr:hypothetical protein [uncultured Methanoregula sp.]
MTRVSEIAEHWLGLCRKAPVFRASGTGINDPREPEIEGSPDGGAGGPGTFRRGIGAALSGTKTLIHNRQLLWFSLLVGVVLAGNLIAYAGLVVFPSSSDGRFFFDADSIRLLPSLVLTFVIGSLALFCLGFILAGLVLSISSKKDRPVSFFRGLERAKKYLIPLTGGSVVSSLAGIQIFVHPIMIQGELFVRNPRWLLFVDSSVDPYVARLLTSLVLTFAVELLTVFCLVFLLAGLVLNISSKKDRPVSFFQGLARAKKYVRPLTGWSVVVALAGTLLFVASQYSNLLNPALREFLSGVLSQFPFNYAMNYLLPPDFSIASLPLGRDWWLIGFALGDTLILSAITVLLFVITLFVVPLIVLEGKSLKESVYGSFTLMKKIWGEVAACVLGLGMVVFAASLVFLLFRFSGVDQVWWDAGQMYTSYSPPGGAWIAVGLLYILALSGVALVVATIGGIAALDLYRNAKIRESEG